MPGQPGAPYLANKMLVRRWIAGLALSTLGLSSIAVVGAPLLRTSPGRLEVMTLATDVVAERHEWARVQVTVDRPATVTFSVRLAERDRAIVFQSTRWISRSYIFEWRGRRQSGRPVPDGAYTLVISSGDRLVSVALAVTNGLGAARKGPKAPPAPTGLAVVATQENILTWDPSSDVSAVSYRIYRSSEREGTYDLIGTTAVGSETFADLPSATGIYWYAVSAVNVKGREGPPSGPVSSDNVHLAQTVGPEGGTLAPTTGTVSLEIPAGAVTSPVDFTIDQVVTRPTPEVNRILVTRVFDIGPSGTTFLLPAILTLRYDIPSQYPLPANYPADTTWAQSYDPVTGTWTRLQGSTVDENSSTVRAEIPHLSLWQAASVTVPHGGYSSTTSLCGYCHQSHQAPGPNLHPYPTQKETCYQCHNGTGATSNVQAEFGESTIGSSTMTSYHPVPAPKDGITIVCGDCHTPHRLRTEYTWLLRVTDGAGGYLYSTAASPVGNQFCYACHGSASTYPAPFGDHAGFQTSIHNTSSQVPNPPAAPGAPDGTGASSNIKCLACHEQHASDQTHLTLNGLAQEALCYSCHTQATPNTSGGQSPPWSQTFPGSNVYNDFNAVPNDYSTTDGNGIRIYHHPIATGEQAAGTRQVECVSCHNSHIADQNDGAATSKAADPGRVTQMTSRWIFGWDFTSGYLSRGSNVTQYCTMCHVSPATTSPISAGTYVPYDIRMVNDTATDADTNVHDKFAATQWSTSRHGDPSALPSNYPGCANRGLTASQCVVTCTNCHDFHGSTNAYMLRDNVISPDIRLDYAITAAQYVPAGGGKPNRIRITIGAHSIGTTYQVVVTGASPAGYNGVYDVDATTATTVDLKCVNASTPLCSLGTNPGAYVGGGRAVIGAYTFAGFGALDIAADQYRIEAFCRTCHVERGSHNAGKLCTQCHYHGSNKL